MIHDLMKHDKEQRQLALDANKSFIVQAPAGSGKTELLIQRFLTLLNIVQKPEEILAITFTKKAANEMRSRIIKALKHAQSEPEPESSHAKQTWQLANSVLKRDAQFNWNLISNPNQLRIQTIDSLCAHLTKQLPLLSHFGSQPDIADNPEILYRQAVQEVLTHVEKSFEWSQAIAKLLLHLDNDLNKLHDLLINLLAKRDQWFPYLRLNANDSEVKNQLERHLSMVIKDHLTQLENTFPRQYANELAALVRYAADNLALSNPESDILACRNLQALPGTTTSDKNAWSGIAKLLLTTEGEWRKSFDARVGFPAASSLKNPQEKLLAKDYKERIVKLAISLHDEENLKVILSELTYLPESTYNDNQWEILQSLLQILKISAAQLRLTFQQYGQIDFIENAQAALLALGDTEHPTDLALALDYQIKHILVDEFQDTAFSQYQLLEKLTLGWETNDGRTLFVVGDPMQSIYRFREAEVGLFIRMRHKGIGNVELIPLTLAMNFRSTANIVDWNNIHFQKIFPTYNDMGTGAVSYNSSVSNQAFIQSDETSIQTQGFLDADEKIQAHHVIQLIQETKRKYPNDSIAVLVRSRPHLAAIIPALKKANVLYHAIDIDPLASRQCIQDLLSLTRAMLHPADRIAWLAIFRAPWCGLTLSDLLKITGSDPYVTIWEQLNRKAIVEQLSEDGQARLKRILPILKKQISERERSNLRCWIENTWLFLGGPACLQHLNDMEDAKAFFQLLDEYSQKDVSINLDKLKEKINQMRASTQQSDGAIQIMTIHSAKGLEFDTVIIPHLERKIPHDDHSLLLWMERPLNNDQIALLLGPIHATGTDKDPIYTYIQRQQKIRANYEMDRLFYVATTRAKKRLHLLFDIKKNKKDEITPPDSSTFLGKLWPFIQKNQHDIISQHHLQQNIELSQEPTRRHIQRLTSTWINPIIEKQFTSVIFHQQTSGFKLAENQSKLIGIVIHKILQLISQSNIAWWTNQSDEQQHLYLSQQFKQLGLLVQYSNDAIKTTLTAIKNVLSDQRGKWILHTHNEAKSEFSLTAMIDNKLMNLVIDRTFIDDNGIRWIIDYKTTTFTHHDLDAFLLHEQEKYLEQMTKYYQAMKLLEDRPIRLGLYFPALSAWKEWEMN